MPSLYIHVTKKLDSCFFLLGCTEKDAMNMTEAILQAVFIGLVVAVFLLNTGRALKAIEVCKECLSFLNNRVVTSSFVAGKVATKGDAADNL